jgi:hypothetical protein
MTSSFDLWYVMYTQTARAAGAWLAAETGGLVIHAEQPARLGSTVQVGAASRKSFWKLFSASRN